MNGTAPVTTSLAGWLRIERSRNGAPREVVLDWFPNLILDNGMDMIGANSGAAPRAVCCVGASNIAPAVNQTELGLLVATSTSAAHVEYGARSEPPYYGYTRTQYTFAPGTAAGTLREVGIGKAGNNLFARSLLRDAAGNPTDIVVLGDDELYITHELRLYPHLEDVTGTTVINGVPTDYIIRPASVNSNSPDSGWAPPAYNSNFTTKNSPHKKMYNGDIGTIFQTPSGVGVNGSSAAGVTATYVPGSFTAQTRFREAEADANIEGGIRSMVRNVKGLGTYQFQFDPPINKTPAMILDITTGVTWSRYAP